MTTRREAFSVLPFKSYFSGGKERGTVLLAAGDDTLRYTNRSEPPAVLTFTRSEAAFLAANAHNVLVEQYYTASPYSHEPTATEDFHSMCETYNAFLTDGLPEDRVWGHIRMEKVLITSSLPEQGFFRVLAPAKDMTTPNRETAYVIMDLTENFLQHLLDAYLNCGGKLLYGEGRRGQNAADLVISPDILKTDMRGVFFLSFISPPSLKLYF